MGWFKQKKKHKLQELFCLKLSNSGDTLKLLRPSHSRKTMSGWTNYPGMVTLQKIIVRLMGYRGSKSVTTLSITVKEQRVDGSWHISVFKGYSKRFRKKFINRPLRGPCIILLEGLKGGRIYFFLQISLLQLAGYYEVALLHPPSGRGSL